MQLLERSGSLEELLLPYERIDVGGSFGKTDTTGLPSDELDPGWCRRCRKTTSRCGRATATCSLFPSRGTRRTPSCGRRIRTPVPTSTAGWTRNRPCWAGRSASCSGGWSADAARQARHGGDQARGGGCSTHLGHGVGGACQAPLPCRRRFDARRHPMGTPFASLVQHGLRAAPRCRICVPGHDRLLQRPAPYSIWQGRWCKWRQRRSTLKRFALSNMRAGSVPPGVYEATFAGATRPFIEALLDAAQVGGGARVLDIACGPGFVASAIRKRRRAGASIFRRRTRARARARDDVADAIWMRVTPRCCPMRMRGIRCGGVELRHPPRAAAGVRVA